MEDQERAWTNVSSRQPTVPAVSHLIVVMSFFFINVRLPSKCCGEFHSEQYPTVCRMCLAEDSAVGTGERATPYGFLDLGVDLCAN